MKIRYVRRIISLALAILMMLSALSLTSCSGGGEAGETTTPVPDGTSGEDTTIYIAVQAKKGHCRRGTDSQREEGGRKGRRAETRKGFHDLGKEGEDVVPNHCFVSTFRLKRPEPSRYMRIAAVRMMA